MYHGGNTLIALMMEAVQTSEKLVNPYQSTRRNNPEDGHLHTHRRENLKSYIGRSCLFNSVYENLSTTKDTEILLDNRDEAGPEIKSKKPSGSMCVCLRSGNMD
jgi:hypothetical protein